MDPVINSAPDSARPKTGVAPSKKLLILVGIAIVAIIALAIMAIRFGDCDRFNTRRIGGYSPAVPYGARTSGCPFWCDRKTKTVQTNTKLDCGFFATDSCGPAEYEAVDYCSDKIHNPIPEGFFERMTKEVKRTLVEMIRDVWKWLMAVE